jgi:spermidine/putrescine transport system ATP-binding protein
VRTANGHLIEVADLSAAAQVGQGDAVNLAWQPDRARIFARRKA